MSIEDGTSTDATKPGKGDKAGKADGNVTVGKAKTPISQQVGRIMMVVAGGIFTLFALFNAQYVDFSWVFGQTEVLTQGTERISGGVPLIILLIASFVLGAIVGLGASARRRKRG